MAVKRPSHPTAGYKLIEIQAAMLSTNRGDYVIARDTGDKASFIRKMFREMVAVHKQHSKAPLDMAGKIALRRAIETWFHIHCKKRRKDAKIGTRNYSARLCFIQAEENKAVISELVEKLREEDNMQKPRFHYYQRAVNTLISKMSKTEWDKWRHIAIRHSQDGPPMAIRIQ